MFEVRKLSRRGSMERGEADLGRVLPMNFPPTRTICFTLSDLDDLFSSRPFSQLLQLRLRHENMFGNPPGTYATGGLFQNHVAIDLSEWRAALVRSGKQSESVLSTHTATVTIDYSYMIHDTSILRLRDENI